MPIAEGKYQCLICDDVFPAKTGTFSKCKCGQSEIEPKYWSYTYKNGNRVKVIEENSYYLEDEFIKLSNDMQEILDEIKRIKADNEYGYRYFLHEMNKEGKDGEKYLSKINISYSHSNGRYSGESNGIELNLSLIKEDYEGHDKAKQRMIMFLDMMKEIVSGELDVSKRSKLEDMAEEKGLYYREEPTGATDFKMYI